MQAQSAQNPRPERSSYRRPLRRRVQRRENIFIQRSRARPRVCSISDTLSRAAHGLQDVQLTRLLRQYGADKGVWHKECTTTCVWSSTLDCLVLDELCSETALSTPRSPRERQAEIRTLNLGNSASKDVLLRLLVAEALEHRVDDALDEISLLALLGLLLEANPAVEDGLDLARKRNLLALNEGLRLELRCLLLVIARQSVARAEMGT